MKRFIIKLFLFCSVVWGLAVVLDYSLSQGLLKMEDYRFQDYRALLTGGLNSDVLIMGNSRGKAHYDPFIIDSLCNVNSFCIGIGGYPINVQVAKYRLYREHNLKPSLIIQNVDFMTLSVMSDIRHQHQSEQFFPLIYDPIMRKELKNMGYGFRELNLPLFRFYGYQQVIKNGFLEILNLHHYVSRPSYKGHRPEEGKWDGAGLEEMEVHPVVVSEESKSIFESFLNECKSDSIKVVLVYSPMYVGIKEKITGLDEVNSYFKRLAEDHGYAFLDYVDNCPISKDTNNFCVSVHMNPVATHEFSRLLCDDLVSLDLIP